MNKKDFKMLMYALYGNKQLIIPDGQTLQQWIDNAFIEKQEQLTLTDVSERKLPHWAMPLIAIVTMSLSTLFVIYRVFYVC